ncbi:MAG: hypothetical protein AB2566_14910, partial [Candidatus Thiodiazotropha sp.]
MNANIFLPQAYYEAALNCLALKRPAVFFRSSGMDAAVAPPAQGCAVGAAKKEDRRMLVVDGDTMSEESATKSLILILT